VCFRMNHTLRAYLKIQSTITLLGHAVAGPYKALIKFEGRTTVRPLEKHNIQMRSYTCKRA